MGAGCNLRATFWPVCNDVPLNPVDLATVCWSSAVIARLTNKELACWPVVPSLQLESAAIECHHFGKSTYFYLTGIRAIAQNKDHAFGIAARHQPNASRIPALRDRD